MGLQFYETGLWQQLRLDTTETLGTRATATATATAGNVSSLRYVAFQVVAARCTIVKTIKKRKG